MQRIVVLGGGESGVGSAVLAKVKGFDVFLSDSGKIGASLRDTTLSTKRAAIPRPRFSTQTRL